MATGIPSGAKQIFMKNILTEIGIKRILAIRLNLAVMKANPQRSSTVFTNGIK